MSERILIVDDDQVVRNILQELLEGEEYEVETASNGLHAWKKLTSPEKRYAMVLLDLNMPGMSGLQLIQMLQQQKHEWIPPIIVLSADSNAIQAARKMGIHHSLTKPFDLEKVLALVASSQNGHTSSCPTER